LESGRVLVSESVLVVDDEETSRQVARALLERAGYVVYEASNGPDAALLAADHWPSFVILDQRMPAMSGEDTSKLIRRITPRAKIVAFSAFLNDLPHWADGLVRKDQIDSLTSVLSSLSSSEEATRARRESRPPPNA
jgi:CheY-like chemotaxis protein